MTRRGIISEMKEEKIQICQQIVLVCERKRSTEPQILVEKREICRIIGVEL